MERRALFMSLGLSFLAMYLVWQYVSSEDKKLEDMYGLANQQVMVVAAREILQYESIKPTDVETIRVPKKMIPPGIINDPKDVIDAVAAVPISKGEQILDNKIISRNVYSGLDTQIALGRRAISFTTNPKSAQAYLVKPGNRIDLAAHFEYKTANQSISEVKTFMQDVLVLATGHTIQSNPPKGVDANILRTVMDNFGDIKDPSEAQEALNHAKTEPTYPTITVELTPSQAQILVYVLTVYADSLSVFLRHTDDRQLAHKATTNLDDVMGPDSYKLRARKLPPPRAVPRVKFYDFQGGERVPIRE